MTRNDLKASIHGSTGEDQAKTVFDNLAAPPHEAAQVGDTIEAAHRFEDRQRVTVIGHAHKPPVYPSVKKSRS